MADQNISGVGGASPHDQKMFEQQYRESADLFEKALNQYSKSDNDFQKDEFKDVMDKSMNVLNETARELMRKELLKQNEKISKDYENFQKFPDDVDTQKKLINDLEKAKKSI